MIGEINGVKIIATPEQYKKCKKSLEEQLEEKDKEIERLKQRLKVSNNTCNYLRNSIDKAIEYIDKNKQKTIAAYGDNYDDDFEICLWEEDIDNLLEILRGGK